MARIRTVKPEFWEDEVVGRLSRDARLLFVGTWNLADDDGRLRWTPAYIRAGLFMYDDLTLPDVRALMDELVDAGLVVPYEVRDQHLAWVRNFSKHQVINRPTPSKLPEPPDLQKDADPQVLTEDSLTAHGGLMEDSLPEGKGKERKGKDPWSLTSEYLLADRGQDPSRDDEELPPVGQRTRAAREVAGLATGATWSDAACDRAIGEAAQLHPEASERQLHDAFIVHALWVRTVSPNRFKHVVDQALREARLDVEAVHDWRARRGPLDRPALEDAS